jgi:hypothetical protein
MLAAGPAVAGPGATRLRESAWRTFRLLSVSVGALSAGWFFLRLPVLGIGNFTGVMNHANLVSPFAAIGALFALVYTIESRSRVSSIICILCLVPCFAAGSRVAVAGLALGIPLVFLVFFRLRGAALAVLALAGLGAIVLVAGLGHEGIIGDVTSRLGEKGLENSREQLWAARLEEFRSKPRFGIGIGMAEGAGVALLEDDKLNVEPGSSYLAVLSMTGVAGAAALAFVFAAVGLRWVAVRMLLPKGTRAEVLAIAAFLAVHGLGEGWILAVGSPFCFLCWLVCGRAADLADGVATPQKNLWPARKGRSTRNPRAIALKPVGSATSATNGGAAA